LESEEVRNGWELRGWGWGRLWNLTAVNVVGSHHHPNCPLLHNVKNWQAIKNGSCDGAVNNRRTELELGSL
jgi:hypothetical protein